MLLELFIACNIRYVFLSFDSIKTIIIIIIIIILLLSKDHTRDTETKGSNKIPYLRTENLKNHTLFHGTYLYSPYMGVPPPPGGVEVSEKNLL